MNQTIHTQKWSISTILLKMRYKNLKTFNEKAWELLLGVAQVVRSEHVPDKKSDSPQ